MEPLAGSVSTKTIRAGADLRQPFQNPNKENEMTTKENLTSLIENYIYDKCSAEKDGHAIDRWHSCSDLRVKGLSKLSIKELRQLKTIFEMDQ